MKRILIVLAIAAFSSAVLPAHASENDTAPPAITEEERILQEAKAAQAPFPVGATIVLDQAVGGGTFVDNPYTRRPNYSVSLDLRPYVRITPYFRLKARTVFTTAVIENFDTTTTYRNRTVQSDTWFDLSYTKLATIPVVGIGVNATLRTTVPTSPESQYATLVTAERLVLSFGKTVGRFMFHWYPSVYKNFNSYTSPSVDTSEVGDHVALAHFKGPEQIGGDLVSVGGNNVSHGIINGFDVLWNITDELALYVYYQISNAWTYNSYPDDEFTSSNAEAGRGQRDSQWGILDLSYQVTPVYSLSIGTSTLLAPKSADNEEFVFPFANFSNNHRASTDIYFDIAATF